MRPKPLRAPPRRSRLSAQKKVRRSLMLIRGASVHFRRLRPLLSGRKGGRRAYSFSPFTVLYVLPAHSYPPFLSLSLSLRSSRSQCLVLLSLVLPRRRMGSLASEILPVVYSWLVLRNVGMFSGLWKPTPSRENTRCNGPRVGRA